MSAAGAFIEMPAERGSATPRNGQQHFDMLPANPLTASFADRSEGEGVRTGIVEVHGRSPQTLTHGSPLAMSRYSVEIWRIGIFRSLACSRKCAVTSSGPRDF